MAAAAAPRAGEAHVGGPLARVLAGGAGRLRGHARRPRAEDAGSSSGGGLCTTRTASQGTVAAMVPRRDRVSPCRRRRRHRSRGRRRGMRGGVRGASMVRRARLRGGWRRRRERGREASSRWGMGPGPWRPGEPRTIVARTMSPGRSEGFRPPADAGGPSTAAGLCAPIARSAFARARRRRAAGDGTEGGGRRRASRAWRVQQIQAGASGAGLYGGVRWEAGGETREAGNGTREAGRTRRKLRDGGSRGGCQPGVPAGPAASRRRRRGRARRTRAERRRRGARGRCEKPGEAAVDAIDALAQAADLGVERVDLRL